MNTEVAQSESNQPNQLLTFFYQYGPYLAFIQALFAMLGSLYFSEIKGHYPCNLCWYQRILMYPLTMITLVGIIKRDEYLPNYVLPFSLLGMCVSLYHYLLQKKIIPSDGCGSFSCDAQYENYFGFITIPFLALVAFIVINVVIGLTYWAYRQQESE